jgi:hypothetical protein
MDPNGELAIKAIPSIIQNLVLPSVAYLSSSFSAFVRFRSTSSISLPLISLDHLLAHPLYPAPAGQFLPFSLDYL